MGNVIHHNVGKGPKGIQVSCYDSAAEDDKLAPQFIRSVRARERPQDVIFQSRMLWLFTTQVVGGDSVLHSHMIDNVSNCCL